MFISNTNSVLLRETERTRIKENNIMEIAYIIGNGQTRINFDLNKLKRNGTTIGCNALYRDYNPDYLIAIDNNMIEEIINYYNSQTITDEKKEYLYNHFWVRHLPKNIEWHNILPPSRGWAAGPTALLLAIETLLYKEIYMLGFDFTGIQHTNKPSTVNNIYNNTLNYKESTYKETFYHNWVRQITILLEEFSEVNIYRVQPEDYFVPKEFKNFSRLKHITYQDFENLIQNSSK